MAWHQRVEPDHHANGLATEQAAALLTAGPAHDELDAVHVPRKMDLVLGPQGALSAIDLVANQERLGLLRDLGFNVRHAACRRRRRGRRADHGGRHASLENVDPGLLLAQLDARHQHRVGEQGSR